MEKLYDHFALGKHYENWEFQLENHQDLIMVDRYDVTDVSHYRQKDQKGKLSKIFLYFNADILVKVTVLYYQKEDNRKSFISYGYEEYSKIE